jgi:hypothetical protein
MSYVGGTEVNFPGSTGTLNYELLFRNPNPVPAFLFAFGNSGVDPLETEMTGMHFLSLSGADGKLYDNDGNYMHSYSHKESMKIEGNIFSGYHNYFINGTIINSDCPRRTGEINAFFYSGISNSKFDCKINEHYGGVL